MNKEEYFKSCITEDGKNYAAIEKIISKESLKCYLQFNPRKSDGRAKYKKYRPYLLNDTVIEALEIKKRYINGDISEEEYKAWCLKYNLSNR